MSLADDIKAAEDQARKEGIASGGNEWFKFEEGDNVFRVLAKPVLFFEKFKVGICYTDCGYQGAPKFLTWVFNQKQGKIQLARLPYSIGEQIAEFEQDEDYKFDGFPMPYNLKVKAKNAGTVDVKYTIIASPTRSEVEPWIMEELRKQNTPEQVVEKMKEKQIEKHKQDGTWQANQDRKNKLAADLASARSSDPDAGLPVDTIEYPKEEVNLDDIPF